MRAQILQLTSLLVLLSMPAIAADSQEFNASLDPGVARADLEDRQFPAGPLAVFALVERAWAEGSVEELVDSLDSDERVRISMHRGGPRGGYFNRDQAFFLFKDMFGFSRTDRFEFEKYWNLDAEGRSPYAVAIREFRMNDGASHTDRVYISLREREEGWVVGEIRSIEH